MIFPPYLKTGDTIGIASTARKVSEDELSAAIAYAEQKGFKTILSPTIYAAENQFAGADNVRVEGFNELLNNPDVKAIWCARGGYGSVRLLEKINWYQLQKTPKWICGFSDVTAIHNHIQQNLNMASLHSEMLVGFEKNTTEAHESLFNALMGNAAELRFQHYSLNKNGSATGQLVGGNLSVIYSMLGSKSQLNTAGKILFLEDLDEYLYHVDRMMMALKRAGMLANLKALVVGGMSDMRDNAIPFGKTAQEIIHDAVAEYDYPLCYNLPAGHIKNNNSLIFGNTATLNVAETCTLKQ